LQSCVSAIALSRAAEILLNLNKKGPVLTLFAYHLNNQSAHCLIRTIEYLDNTSFDGSVSASEVIGATFEDGKQSLITGQVRIGKMPEAREKLYLYINLAAEFI
jgi:hypothetical protein